MQRTLFLPMLAMAMVVVASNILVQFLLGDWLTWGALTYPLAFFVTDVTNRLHGPVAARRPGERRPEAPVGFGPWPPRTCRRWTRS